MPEVLIGFPRAFVEFGDPADNGRSFAVTSPGHTTGWACIYGEGCRGIYADRPNDGCCTSALHFADAADEARRQGGPAAEGQPVQERCPSAVGPRRNILIILPMVNCLAARRG